MILKYDPAQHEVVETELVGHLRRRFNEPNFVTYRHRQTQNWVLGVWDRPRQTMLELDIIGPALTNIPRVIAKLKNMDTTGTECDQNARDNVAWLKGDDRRYRRELQDDADQQIDNYKAFRKALPKGKRDHPAIRWVQHC